MGLRERWRQVQVGLTAIRAWDRLKKEAAMRGLKVALTSFSGMFLTYAMGEILRACPSLVAQVDTIVGAGMIAAVGFWLKRPVGLRDASWKLLLLGSVSAGWVALRQAFGDACPAIAANWWGFLSSLALGGLTLFIKSPQESSKSPQESSSAA